MSGPLNGPDTDRGSAARLARARPGDPLAPFARGPVLGIAAGSVTLLVVFASRYGYHRDELYFLAASRHVALGYVDQPPFAVLVAWFDRVALGDTLLGLRIVPALVIGAVVVVTGLLARELGARRFAQGFAAASVASGGLLVVGHLEGPTVYDVLIWALASWVVVRILRTGNERLWLVVGLVVGIGMEAKQTVPLLFAGLAVGFLLNGQRRLLVSPWLWSGAALALLGAAPNFVWEATHSWPTLTMDANLHAEHSGLAYAIKYPFITLLAYGALLAPVWLSGVWALWSDGRWRPYRAFAVAYALGLVFLWVYIPDRFYYLFGISPILFAAGAVVTEDVVDGTRGFFRSTPGPRRLWRSRRAAVAILIVNALVFLPLGLPVLPPTAVASANLNKINYNLGEEIGWPELVRQVDRAWRSLPARERSHAVVLTGNYGEAGALVQAGAGGRGPAVYSGHNSFWSWGPPPDTATTVVAVGMSGHELRSQYRSCRLVARVHNRAGVDNDEQGASIRICTEPTAPWSKTWGSFRHYD